MKKQMHFGVIGGDMRQGKLAQLLAKDGHRVHTFGLEGLPEPLDVPQAETLKQALSADCIVLPLPMCSESTVNMPFGSEVCSVETLLAGLNPEQVICAGKVEKDLLRRAADRGLTLHDYFARDELTIANAIPTAEGTIQIAMEETPYTLHGARVLILGFGRVGKALPKRFSALGSHVSVAARRFSDLAWIESEGVHAIHMETLNEHLPNYDLIINTVPSRILDEARLTLLASGSLCIDLASRPGGIDFEAAARLGVKAVWALSLPGKVAPVSAGKAIRDTIYNILHELGV